MDRRLNQSIAAAAIATASAGGAAAEAAAAAQEDILTVEGLAGDAQAAADAAQAGVDALSGALAEAVRDAIGAALVAGVGVSIAVNDPADTITIARSHRGALVKKSADLTAQNLTGGVDIGWDAEVYDTGNFHDNVTNDDRITIPAGVAYVRISAQVFLANNTADTYAQLQITKNGALFDGVGFAFYEVGSTSGSWQAQSAIVPVTGGDIFRVSFVDESDTSVDILAARSWFAIEVIA